MRSPQLLRLAALVEVMAPAAAGAVVFFGGATVSSCLGGGVSCGQPVLVVPPIRTNAGIAVSLAVCGVAWLVANYVVLAHMAQVNRGGLVRLAMGIGVATVAMAAVGFGAGLSIRLRYAAEGAVAWGIAGLALAWVIGVAWAGLRPGRVTLSNAGVAGRPTMNGISTGMEPQDHREFGRIDEVARALVEDSPDPPRPTSLARLVRVSYGSTAGKAIVGVALLLGLPLAAIELWAAREDAGHLAVAVCAVVFALLLLVVPMLPARRAERALRFGVRATAEVTAVRYRPRGDRTTVDSISHGFASGRWRVAHPLSPFDAKFETDAPWSGRLDVGTKVSLLVDPLQPVVLLQLGPDG
jgi:hypothetical protein